jgi:hypothetical protein
MGTRSLVTSSIRISICGSEQLINCFNFLRILSQPFHALQMLAKRITNLAPILVQAINYISNTGRVAQAFAFNHKYQRSIISPCDYVHIAEISLGFDYAKRPHQDFLSCAESSFLKNLSDFLCKPVTLVISLITPKLLHLICFQNVPPGMRPRPRYPRDISPSCPRQEEE